MKKFFIALILFLSSLSFAQIKQYSIGSMQITDSSGIAKWNNRSVMTTRSFLADTLLLNGQRLHVNDIMFGADSVKYVSKKYYGDKAKNTFVKVQNAIDSSGVGSLIVVYPGTYSEAVKLKTGVNLWLQEATIQYDGQDTIPTIRDSLAVVCSIFGTGNIVRGNVDAGAYPDIVNALSPIAAIMLRNSSSNIYVELNSVDNDNGFALTTVYNTICSPIIVYGGMLSGSIRFLSNYEFEINVLSGHILYQKAGVINLEIDSAFASGGGRTNYYFRNSSQFLTIHEDIDNVFIYSSKSSSVLNLKNITGEVDADTNSYQEINCSNFSNHSTNLSPTNNVRYGARQVLNCAGNIALYNGSLYCYKAHQFIKARNIFQTKPNISSSPTNQILLRNDYGFQVIDVQDSITAYYTMIYMQGFHYPKFSSSFSSYDSSRVEINAQFIGCLNDTGHAILNDFGRVYATANKIVSGGYATCVSNGGEMQLYVQDSIRSRANVPTARASGDSCVAIWATARAELNIIANVIRADSTCYAMLLQDSATGQITANEISSEHGPAIKFLSNRTIRITNANIKSDSINGSGFYIASIIIGTDNLELQNCQISTLKQTGTCYSISPISSATNFGIIGNLQANKNTNIVRNTKGVYIKDGELLIDVYGADASINTKGYTRLGDLAPSIKQILIRGTAPATSTIKTFAHGFTGNGFKRFISITAQIRDDTTTAGATKWWLPNTPYPTLYNYQFYCDSLNCTADFTNNTATKLFSDSIYILITYNQ